MTIRADDDGCTMKDLEARLRQMEEGFEAMRRDCATLGARLARSADILEAKALVLGLHPESGLVLRGREVHVEDGAGVIRLRLSGTLTPEGAGIELFGADGKRVMQIGMDAGGGRVDVFDAGGAHVAYARVVAGRIDVQGVKSESSGGDDSEDESEGTP